MTKVTIISGFLGAGKTTLIKKLLKEAFKGEKCVLLENEYGEVGIDGGFMKDSGIQITELNSGCICCTLAGDFTDAIGEIVEKFNPDRLLIEPSGVGKLSDIRRVVEEQAQKGLVSLSGSATVVDAAKCKMYLKNFGEFFIDQVKCAETVIFSRSQLVSEEKLKTAFELVRELNADARIITTNWTEIDGQIIVDAIEHPTSLIDVNSLYPPHEHHHDDDEDEDEDEHEHHHHHEHEEGGHEHHHHHDDDDDDEHEHGHHHHHHHDHEGGEVEEYGIGTFVYYRRQPFNMARFDEFVARKMPKNVIRVKGICYFKNEYDMCYIFEQAGKQVQLRDAGQWFATMPADELEAFMDREPTLRRDWDDTYGDRMQKLVFIGQHMDKDALVKDLDACLTQ
ncbi:MAG: GTP-binding protein [Schwartzia sp.]|nr:GTP-binding protein [Schwartzia sp. (in: firmicutes)]